LDRGAFYWPYSWLVDAGRYAMRQRVPSEAIQELQRLSSFIQERFAKQSTPEIACR
jgi:hypothetical protein